MSTDGTQKIPQVTNIGAGSGYVISWNGTQAGSVSTDIYAQRFPVNPGPETLPLNNGRFNGSVSWKNPHDAGSKGVGTASSLTRDSGFLTSNTRSRCMTHRAISCRASSMPGRTSPVWLT